jgi:hypothetical protein
MKKVIEKLTITNKLFIVIIAFVLLPIPAYANSFDRAFGYDLHGSDYDDYKNVTLEQCQYYCNRDSRCEAFSWIESRRWCWLKDSVPRGWRDGDVISGIKK